ncbi:putative Ig domain-containing protein [Spirosoma sp. SC4-14]|uniref:putative Ig domain-containing protein n=1 Tax=Spirosoma sp. SC4-14 TaxID=3128900 RepID=UPI0030CAF5B8
MNRYVYLVLLFLGFGVSHSLFATNKFWTGTTNNDWNTANNWNPSGVPTASDNVYINGGTGNPVIGSGTTATIISIQIDNKTLTINSGGQLNVRGDGTLYKYVDLYPNSILINYGTLAMETAAGGPVAGVFGSGNYYSLVQNYGTIRVNSSYSTAVELGGNVGQSPTSAIINNYACGQFIIVNGNLIGYDNIGSITNSGLLQVQGSIYGVNSFTNNGVLKYGSNYVSITSNNGSVIVNDNPTNSTIFTYTGTFLGTVNGIYTNSAATTSAGTFTAPNTFVPSGLSSGAQTLYAKITPSGGGCTYIVPFTYTYTPPPVFSTNPASKSVCSGSGTTFTVAASGANSYQWQVNTGGGFNNISNTTPYSGATGTTLTISNVAGLDGYQYRCVATGDGGNTNSGSATLTVNPLPTANILTPASTSITCSTPTLSLTATGGSTYRWDNNSTNAIRSVSSSGTYSVTVTSASGCTAVDSQVIGVNTTPPTASVLAPASTTITCSTPNLSLTATGGGTYRWDDNSTNAIRSVSSSGTYSVTVTGTNGCTAVASRSISANTTTPTVSITAGNGGALTCNVSVIGLTASGGTSYRWDNNQTTDTRNVNAAGVYSVTVTADNGCTATSSFTVTSDTTPPTPTLSASPSATLTCNQTSLTLTAGGGPSYHFSGPGIIGINSAAGTATLNTAGVYSVTVTGANGCTATTNTTIYSNTAVVSVTNPLITTATVGTAFSQTFTTSSGTAPLSFSIASGSLPTGLNLATTGVLSGIPTQSGSFSITVRATDANGCSAIGATYSLLVSTTATVTTAPPSSILGTSATLGGNVTADGGASVTDRGVVYMTGNGTPTTSNTKVTMSSGTGSFSQTVSNLSGGTTYSVRAYAINVAGTSYGAVQSFSTTSAPSAPVVITPANGSLLSNNKPPYTGTAAPNSSVTVFVDGSNLGQINTDVSGNWSYTPSAPLTDGPHQVYAIATFNGLDSPNSNTNNFTIDTTPPASPVVTTPANGQITSDNTPTYTGTAESNSTVTVYVDNSAIGTAPADASGNWSFTPTTPLPDGSHSVRATAADLAGNTSPNSNTNTFTIDTVVPTVSLSSTAPDPTNTSPIPLTIIFSESVTGFLAGDIAVTNGTLSDFTGSGSQYTVNIVPVSAGVVSASVASGVAQDMAGNGNSASNLFSIQYNPLPTISDFLADPDPVCAGNQVTFSASLGNLTGSYAYTLTNGTSTTTGNSSNANFSQLITTTTSGIQAFSLTVSSNGQSATEVYELTVSELPAATLTASNGGVLTCAQTSLTLTATGGDDFVFSGPGILSQDPEGGIAVINASGVYSVTVTNTETGCFSTTSTTVTSDTATPSLSITPTSTTLTCANPSATLTANGTGSVLWSTGETTSAITVSAAGTYSVTLTSGSGCTATASASVQADQTPPSVSITPTSTTLTCANPSATLTANGTGSVLWSTGETTSAITVSEAGTYSVTLTSGSGCTATASASVQADQTAPSVSITPISTTLTCANPSATLTANGTGSVLWSTGETTSAITVSEAGTYSVTLTSGSGCTATANASVQADQTAPSVSITPTSTTLTCANPSATLTANGTGSVLWSTGETTSAITVSEAGTYSVTLTSGSGCTATANASVQADQTAPSVSITPTSTTLTCANPSATLTANGTGSVLWSTGETTSAITVSEAGTYSVTLTSGSGCTATASASVQADQTAPSVSITPTSTTLTCANPSATLTANGTGSVLWSTGETTSAITVSAAATYSVTLTSGSGCTATASASVQADQATPSLSITPTSTTLTCANPSATLTANGTGSVLWSTGETTSAITVSEAGTYSVTLTSGSGCTATASASVQADQTAPTVSITPSSTTLTCANLSATLTANGTGSVLWSTGETTSAITVSEAGTYSVTLTSGSGCTATASASVQADQTAPTVSITPTSTTLTCANPSATLTANGTGSVLWSTGETTSAITVSAAGTYSVTLTSGSGCTATANASVQADQTAPTVSITPTSTTLTCANPSATLTANGTGSVLWSTGETTSAITVSAAGTYSVTLTSGSGCTATASASVQADQTAPSVSITPTSTTLTCANPSATLTANGTGSVLWSTGETTSAITVSEAGTYSVTLTSGSGCTATASASVQADQTAPSVSITPTSTTLTCANPSATLTANGTGSVLWSTGETTSAITVSEAGTYSVTLTSGSGCTATANASVQADQTAPTVSITPSSTTLTCANPSATLTANGTGSVLWSTGETTSAITVSAAGTYSVTLTSGSGCTATANASVQADQTAPSVSITPTSTTLTCANPSATLTANGTGSVLWSTGETTSAITVSEAGTYSVTLTSGSGCTATANASVQADQTAPSVSITPTSTTLTCANPSATLTANGTGSVLWSTGETTSAITVSAAGTYSVTLTSGSGCTATASASVEELTGQTIAFTQQPASTSSVTVGDNVSVYSSVSGQALSFQWYKDNFANPVASQTTATLTLTNVQLTDAGSYSLVVTGACNSLTSTAFNLSVDPVVSAPFAITSVTLFNCTPIDAYKRVISFQPNYTGLTGQPISFSVVNEMVPTTASGPYTLQMYTDNPVIVLNAIQQGTPQPAVYSFNWQEACQTIGSNNTPPTLVSSPANQTLTENQAFSLNLGGVFTDNETPNSLILSATGLPNGLTLNGVILSGSSSQIGTTTVTLTATDPSGLTANTSFMITVVEAPQGNTPPTVVNTPTNQTATQGQPFSLNLDGVFTDNETPNSLTLSAAGLPNGLNLIGTVLSGTPSQTGTSTVTLTATDPGNLSTSTHFMITVSSGETPGNFAIQSVTTINCTPISDNRFDISFQPNYSGLNGQPITFGVYNELIPTTKEGPYSLQLYPDNPVVLLQATQQGSEGMATFSYNWLEACQANPPANTAPWLLTPVANQTATSGQFFSLNLAGTFTDGETPNSLALTASGLPGGFAINGTTLSGTTSQTGTFAVTLTATDPGNLSTSTNFEIVVSPASSQTTTPGNFAITGVSTVSCEVVSAGERRVSFTPQYDGVTGQTISFRVVNEMVPTTAAGPYTLNLYTDNPTITLKATQQGTAGEASYSYNWLAACNTPGRVGAPELRPVEVVILGNPVVGEVLQVEVRGSQGQQVHLQVVDQQGNRVSDVNRNLESSQEKLQLKLGATGGVYLLQVESESHRQTIKIVKQ